MKPLPLPVRIAAGLVATAVEQARGLPRLVVEFPVTAVSQALQASMRVQQRITELAIKGDRALGSWHPAPDTPSWATFDEDLPATNGAGTVAPPGARPGETQDRPEPTDRPREEPATTAADVAAAVTERAAAGGTAGGSTTADEADEADAGASGPNVLPGYAAMTIPQLRARLRRLTLDDLRALLAWEQAHGNRPPFVTMLDNRITTVTHE